MKKSTEDLMGISGSVPATLHAAMEDNRWSRKMNMSQMVRTGLEAWAISEGFWTPDAPVSSDDPELSEDQRAAVAADEARAAEATAKAEADAKTAADAKAAEDAAKAENSDAAQGEAGDATPEQEEPAKTTSRSRK